VFFVVWLGKTTAERAKASMDLFKLAGARVIGTVLNRIPRRLSFYYGGEEYHSHYGKSEAYFSGNGAGPEKNSAEESHSIKTELSRKNLMLYRTATLSPGPDEFSPPDPPRD
jgi:Mrp family chromosome partitioning ATPase